ncbi:MAG: 23S rRNA (adenine(2503)-C(2))-methyltransferase RlmN, partial [Microcystis wesenbergii Mw_QC_S_20081001_S30D]
MTLLAKSLEELTDWVKDQGQPAYRGKQLHQWLYEKGVHSLADIS